MQETSKKPALRFAGFNDAWEQRKLEEIVEFLDAKRKPIEEGKRIKGPYPYYGASGIVDFISDYLFDEELILLSEDGANITDRNYPICFLASGKYWVNNHAHVLKSKHGYDNNFICNAMERKDYANYNTGMAMPKLNQDVCRAIPILSPCYEEQKLIGIYFRALDNLITLHQRQGKPSLIDPFLMFQEYTSAWEQREFGESFDLLTNNTLSRAELNDENGTALNVHYGDILVKFGEMIDLAADHLPYITDPAKVIKSAALQNGDVIIADTAEDSTVGKCSEITGIIDKIVVSGLHTIPCRPRQKFAPGYLGYFMNSPAYHDQLLPLMQGTKVTSVSKSALEDTLLCYPTDSDEQALIGRYFMNLDNLITLHQREYFKQQTEAKNVKYNQRDGPFL